MTTVDAVAARVRGAHRSAQPSAIQQWWVLSLRVIKQTLRNGEILMAIISPIVFTVGFYLPLKFVMSFQVTNFAQYLMPIIALQALTFTALSAAMRAASDAVAGMNNRLRTMPIGMGVPLAARMSSSFFRLLISLGVALLCGYTIGFRFTLGPVESFGFCLFALLVGFTLTLAADAIGTLSSNPESTTQSLMIPQLILGMLSSGFVPVSSFPTWIQPFVRNQPISHFATAMRDMTQGGVTWHVLWPALAWALGLIVVFAPLSIWASLRRK